MAKSKIIFNNTKDNNGCFRSGFIVSRGTKYMTIRFLTNEEGHTNKTCRLSISGWNALHGDALDKCLNIQFNGYLE